jgi:hypothetical protein
MVKAPADPGVLRVERFKIAGKNLTWANLFAVNDRESMVAAAGRREFALMMVSASVVSWAGVWIAIAVFDISVTAYEPMATVALTPLFVPGLIANDLERSSPLMVFSGLVYSVSFVFTTTWLVTTAVTGYTGAGCRCQWQLPSLWSPVWSSSATSSSFSPGGCGPRC